MRLAGGKPGADLIAERVAEAAIRDVEDTPSRRPPVADAAVAADAESAEARGSPINADHRVASLSCDLTTQELRAVSDIAIANAASQAAGRRE